MYVDNDGTIVYELDGSQIFVRFNDLVDVMKSQITLVL